MIREAVIEDIPVMVKLGKEFFDFTELGRITEYDADSAAKTFKALIENEMATILLIEIDGKVVGGAGAVLSPFYFNLNHITGQEFFWFVSEKYRGTKESLKLFNALEGWAKDQGANSFFMIALKCNDGIKKLYEHKGYYEQETHFARRV